jgi:hypothetical protein
MKLELYRQKLKYVGTIERLENINEFFLVCVNLFNFFLLHMRILLVSYISSSKPLTKMVMDRFKSLFN